MTGESKPIVLVTGGGGQLGTAIADRLRQRCRVVPITRATRDLTDHEGVVQLITDAQPDVIVNCAAYNEVDAAEEDAKLALAVNAMAVHSLARAAECTATLLVHYSTDFVFDGEAHRPYVEEDRPSPQSVYAQSKLVGEWFATDAPRHYVLRIESLFGGPRARSSVNRIAQAIREHREVRAFLDRTVTPSFVDDVAAATEWMIEVRPPYGVYHCVNSGVTTWLDLARETARLLHAEDAQIVPVSVADVSLRAKRPRYAALSNAKLAQAGFPMPSWQQALAAYLSRARHDATSEAQNAG